jgi:hypothetical protein
MTDDRKNVEGNLEWIAADADAVAELTDRLDAVALKLRDLCDSLAPRLDDARLRERLSELAREIEHVAVVIGDRAERISERIRAAPERGQVTE